MGSAPTPADLEVYHQAVTTFVAADPEMLAAGRAHLRAQTLPRGAFLLHAGDVATMVAFVVRGVLREFFTLPDGTERTKAFVVEGEISGSLADLLSGSASQASIIAEESTRVLIAPHAALRELGAHHDGWAQFGRRVKEALLARKAQREYELLALDAGARYAAFTERFPGIEARVAAKHVASYVGITPVHLSRLRRRRRAERTTR